MIKDKETTKYILKNLSSKERVAYIDYLSLTDGIREKLLDDGEVGALTEPSYQDMYNVAVKVKNLQNEFLKSSRRN